ncbi:hypothetical protein L6164_026480 [Bauhinia variegata]|uniref:Uncharacterized protein n=1 Tax=Bauhinia variegata TaxID=167791 RepID=A0ACB9LRS4_BAUVA|nr:hypothetical protein L6164_026480 [Bauhinia variegata]
MGKVAYKLKLLKGSRVHPVFHVSQLKVAVGQGIAESKIPIELEQKIPVVKPEELLKHRTINRNNQEVSQVLVKWKNLPLFEATWEDKAIVQSQFLEISLEDKAVSPQGGPGLGAVLLQKGHLLSFLKKEMGKRFQLMSVEERELYCVTGDKPTKWTELLPLKELCYNTKWQASTNTTPFEALYGYPNCIQTHGHLGNLMIR